MYIYKVIASNTGFAELEKKVSESINKGWKPQGGVAFNVGYCYQAMIGKRKTVENKNDPEMNKTTAITKTANEAIKALDQLI